MNKLPIASKFKTKFSHEAIVDDAWLNALSGPTYFMRQITESQNGDVQQYRREWNIDGFTYTTLSDATSVSQWEHNECEYGFHHQIMNGVPIVMHEPLWRRTKDHDWNIIALSSHLILTDADYGIMFGIDRRQIIAVFSRLTTTSHRLAYIQRDVYGPSILKLDTDGYAYEAYTARGIGTHRFKDHVFTKEGLWAKPEYEYVYREGDEYANEYGLFEY